MAEPSPLSQALWQAVRAACFDQVVDFGPVEEACPGADFCPQPAPVISQPPNVDVAVLQLDRQGRLLDQANVLLSRDYPDGLIVPCHGDRGSEAVNWLAWDIDHWNGGRFDPATGQIIVNQPGGPDHPAPDAGAAIVPGRDRAPYRFHSPYPASNFKLLIAFYCLRLVDRHELALEGVCTYRPPAGPPETRSLAGWLDPMLTVSDNHATKALLQHLGRLGKLADLNQEFAALGLATLQLHGVNPVTGYRWQPGRFHMTAFDTARLLWLIEGSADSLWTSPEGAVIRAGELSDSSRLYLKKLLSEQALHEVLSTGNLAGAEHVQPGIPARVPERWINPTDGTVSPGEIHYGCDVRPANARAEVSFAHKTGLTYNYGSDAGIVEALPGQPAYRHYVIAFFSNLGYRYADPVFASAATLPGKLKTGPICYTQRIAGLGRQLDDWFKQTGYARFNR